MLFALTILLLVLLFLCLTRRRLARTRVCRPQLHSGTLRVKDGASVELNATKSYDLYRHAEIFGKYNDGALEISTQSSQNVDLNDHQTDENVNGYVPRYISEATT